MLLESSFLTGFGAEDGNTRLGTELPVGCLLGIIVGESESMSPGGSDGLKLGLFSKAGAGLLVVGGKKFQAGCIVGPVVEGDDESWLLLGGNRFEAGFIVGLFVAG